MTLVALVFLGFKEAVIVTFLRVAIGSILGGTFLGATFFLFTGSPDRSTNWFYCQYAQQPNAEQYP
jgi:uncharacterized membrane protein